MNNVILDDVSCGLIEVNISVAHFTVLGRFSDLGQKGWVGVGNESHSMHRVSSVCVGRWYVYPEACGQREAKTIHFLARLGVLCSRSLSCFASAL
jgi:hypothetical protein